MLDSTAFDEVSFRELVVLPIVFVNIAQFGF